MAYQLRSEGINATAGSLASWKGFADDIIRRSKTKSVSYPVVFVGHSFGADAGPDVANYLGKNGIPVALVIGFDAVSNKTLHWGAKQVVHYCTPTAALYRAGAGFNGRIRTVNVARFGVNHFSIDENRQVQELAMQDIRAAVRKNR
jgi:thioesterase domain-containing protein